MSAYDPRREQQMDNQIQQDLGNGLYWAYFAIADFLLFMFTLIKVLQRSHDWQWYFLAFLVSVFLTYEFARHRSRKVALAASQPAAPLPLPTPDRNWRKRTALDFIFPCLIVLGMTFTDFEPWKLLLLLMLPIAFYIRWQMMLLIQTNIQKRRDDVLAQDRASGTSGVV